jgi:hypothetical protein
MHPLALMLKRLPQGVERTTAELSRDRELLTLVGDPLVRRGDVSRATAGERVASRYETPIDLAAWLVVHGRACDVIPAMARTCAFSSHLATRNAKRRPAEKAADMLQSSEPHGIAR